MQYFSQFVVQKNSHVEVTIKPNLSAVVLHHDAKILFHFERNVSTLVNR